MNTLLIGYGGIAREVLALVGSGEDARIAGILVRENRREEARAAVAGRSIEVGCALDDFTFSPDLCAECAGHGAVREWGVKVLGRGIDFLVVSIGVLADEELHDALASAARTGGAKMILAAGAVAGTDALAAARAGGLESVVYTSRKPPGAWKGTAAEAICDLDSLTGEMTLYAGPADEASRRYPQNANVAATVALAGAGFKATEVRLVADPEAERNTHRVSAKGAFGALEIEVAGRPLRDNPKTSALAAHSVVAAIRRYASTVQIGG